MKNRGMLRGKGRGRSLQGTFLAANLSLHTCLPMHGRDIIAALAIIVGLIEIMAAVGVATRTRRIPCLRGFCGVCKKYGLATELEGRYGQDRLDGLMPNIVRQLFSLRHGR